MFAYVLYGFAVLGFLCLIFSILVILGALCFQRREDLSKFGEDPFKPKLSKIVRLPNVERMCPGKPRGRL